MNTKPLATIGTEEPEIEYTDRLTVKVIVKKDDTYLVLNSGLLPGGGVEPDESEHDAITRELQEEIGITVKDIAEIGTVIQYRTFLGQKYIVKGYTATLDQANDETSPQDDGEAKFVQKWLTIDEAFSLVSRTIAMMKPLPMLGDNVQGRLYNIMTTQELLKVLMNETLSHLHKDTYDTVAEEYEGRVETLRPTTEAALANFTNLLHEGATVLDIGCAVGYTVEIMRTNGMVVDGIDIAPKMIEYAQRRNPGSNFIVGDFLEVEYPEATYDGILMYAFLHLFPKDIAIEILKKAVRVTKPGGLIFTGTTKSDEASEGLEIKHDYEKEVKRYRKRWTQTEIEAAFAAEGLVVVDYAEKTDEFGKVWMDYIVRTPSV